MKNITSFITTCTIAQDKDGLRKMIWTSTFTMAWASNYMVREYIALRNVFAGFRPRGSFRDSNYYHITSIMVFPMSVAIFHDAKG